MLNLTKHPITHVRNLIEQYQFQDALFVFKRYERLGSSSELYAPYIELDTLRVSGADILSDTIEKSLENPELLLPYPEWQGGPVELAICAPVAVPGMRLHYLPLLDLMFAPKSLCNQVGYGVLMVDVGKRGGKALVDANSYNTQMRLVHYETGRGFHAYGTGFLSESEYPLFLGAALTQTQVDTRWVGHALMRGYGALRWTCASSEYKQLPTLMMPSVPDADPDTYVKH